MRLLLVEDDPHLAPTLIAALTPQYIVSCVSTVQQAREELAQSVADLFIIDIGLPDGSGLSLVPAIRSRSLQAPILILTAERGTAAKVGALDTGADDYLTKPFSLRELQARLRALLRRTASVSLLEMGDMRLDCSSHLLHGPAGTVHLPKRLFVLLEFLMAHQGRICSREQLTELIWEETDEPTSNALVVYIGRLRRTLEKVTGAHFIRAVPGFGYVLETGRKASYGRSDDGSSH